MTDIDREKLRDELVARKTELEARMQRITANVRRGYHPDSKERAKELEDVEVVDALGNEARRELQQIREALLRLDDGKYGVCVECGGDIESERLRAHPFADECIDCARYDEDRRKRQQV